jgi:hypothetical protein
MSHANKQTGDPWHFLDNHTSERTSEKALLPLPD